MVDCSWDYKGNNLIYSEEGYYEYIQLNNVEKDTWNDILRFVFIDEGLWAIVDLEDDESQRQKEFIKSLIEFNEEDFEL